MSFILRFQYRFEAAHRFTQSRSVACMTPHGHSWQVSLAFRARAKVGADDMIEEFSALKARWKSFIQDTVDHSFFCHYQDPILPTLEKEIPGFRGLLFPGDPTTEMVAAAFLAKAMTMNRSQFGEKTPAMPEKILIRETQTNRIEFRASSLDQIFQQVPRLARHEGWWVDPDVKARWLGLRANQPQLVESSHTIAKP